MRLSCRPVDDGERQEGDCYDGLRVQDDEGEAQQPSNVGEEEVCAEGQRIIHDRRIAAEPVQQPPCAARHREGQIKTDSGVAQVHDYLGLSEPIEGRAPDGTESNQAMGARSTAHSIRVCSSRAAISPAVANEKARTYRE